MDEQTPVTTPKSAKTSVAVPVAIVIAGGLIAVALYFGGRGATPMPLATTTAPTATPITVDGSKLKTDGEAFIGKADAPVTVFEFFDYQCPFCKAAEVGGVTGITSPPIMPDLIKNYVNTGKVKVVYKDFAFLGADSQTAGLVARAVWEVAPDKFAAWHQAMFTKQDSENSGWGSQADVIALTKTIPGIDVAKVQQLVATKSADYQKAMDADKAEGQASGITGTPSFVIGKQLLPGVGTYASFEAAIKAAGA